MALVDTPPVPADRFARASFTGSASEYFGIWIVNVLLTILTLGIYSAWAKVRRKRYFHGNTVLLGRTFEYHAKGSQIFVGRLIVIGALIAVNVLGIINPFLTLATWLLIVIGLPWLIKRSLRFNARVTSYRNVRFDFVGSTGGAFVAVTLGGIVAFVSSASWRLWRVAGCGATSSTISVTATEPFPLRRASVPSTAFGCFRSCCLLLAAQSSV